MDPTSFAAPSRVRALVVPASPQPVAEFMDCVDRLKRAHRVPLIDVHLPSDSSSAQAMDPFDPKSHPQGAITYEIETSASPKSHNVLYDLELWRKQLVVIGIQLKETSDEESNSALQQLRKQFPAAIYHAIIKFTDSDAESSPQIFCVQVSNWTSVETVMAQLSGEFLGQMGSFWIARQLASFQSPLELLPSSEKSYMQQNSSLRGHSRASNMSVAVGKHGSISMNNTEKAKHQQNGRSLKYYGTLLLLAGNPAAALSELGHAAQVLHNGGDHLWYGTALSEISLCLALLLSQSVPIQIPSIAISASWSAALKLLKSGSSATSSTGSSSSTMPGKGTSVSVQGSESSTPNGPATPPSEVGSPRAAQRTNSVTSVDSLQSQTIGGSSGSTIPLSSIPIKKSKPFTSQTPVEQIIEFLVAAALDEYAVGQGSELVPYTVYYETVTRYAGLLVNLRYLDWSASLESVTMQRHTQSTNLHAVPLSLVDQWIMRVYDLSTELSPDIKAKILGTVARLYAACGMKRKWAFACAQIVSLLASSAATVDADLGEVQNVLHVYSIWPNLEAQMLRKLVALGHRIKNPTLQTNAASRLLQMASRDRKHTVDFDASGGPKSTSAATNYPGLIQPSSASIHPLSSGSSSNLSGLNPGLNAGISGSVSTSVSASEQLTLYHLIRNFGDIVQSPFWDPEIVVNSNIRVLRVNTAPSRTSHQEEGIIYNPFDGQETKEDTSVEAGVPTKGRVWLRNPRAVDIQIFQLGLVDKENNLISEIVEDFVVPAHSSQFRVDTTVVPSFGSGDCLEATGCLVHAVGCSSTIYKLPNPTRIPIVPPRPILALQELSLLKGCVMLLEGEKKQFTVELWNSSQTDCKILHYGYSETTKKGGSSTVNINMSSPQRGSSQPFGTGSTTSGGKRDVSRIDLYESEYQSQHRQAIQLCDKQMREIPAHESQKYTFSILGKPGIQAVSLLVDYGYTSEKLRRIKIPLQVSVHRGVWIDRFNILPAPTNKQNCVLLMLDIRSSWRQTIKCNIWNKDDDEPKLVDVEPAMPHRLILEVPWKTPSADELAQPIPLSNPRLQKSIDTTTNPNQIQIFWLREKLLDKLRSKWEVEGREGAIELRKIELTSRMADILRGHCLEIRAELRTEHTLMDKPVNIQVLVRNNGDRKTQGMLRLAPNRAAQKFMLIMGCAQQLVTLGPQEEIKVDFDMLFVSKGMFQVAAIFDSPDGSEFQNAQTTISVA